MRRVALALFLMLALMFGVTSPAGAQDLNCADFNGDQDAAQRELNSTWPNDPHNLDGNSDGWACEGVFGYIGSEPNAANQGGGGGDDTGTNNGEDTGSGGDDVSAGDTGNGSDGDTTELPATGSGTVAVADSDMSALGAVAVLLLVAGAIVRRVNVFRV